MVRREDDSTLRLAGVAGLVAAGMLVLAFVLDLMIIITTGGQPQIMPATFSADLVRAHGSLIWAYEQWVYTLLAIPFVIFIVGVRRTFRDAGQATLVDAGCLMAVLLMVVHTLHNVATLTVVQVLGSSYVPGTADGAMVLAVARGILGYGNMLYLPGGGVGSILLMISMGTLAVAQRQSAFRSWIPAALAALLTGLAYLQWLGGISASNPFTLVALVGWLAFIAWTLSSTLGLLRRVGSGMALAAQAT